MSKNVSILQTLFVIDRLISFEIDRCYVKLYKNYQVGDDSNHYLQYEKKNSLTVVLYEFLSIYTEKKNLSSKANIPQNV